MTRHTWIYTIAAVVLVLVLLGVWAGMHAQPLDDDDSAWAAGRVDDDDTIFDMPEPGVL